MKKRHLRNLMRAAKSAQFNSYSLHGLSVECAWLDYGLTYVVDTEDGADQVAAADAWRSSSWADADWGEATRHGRAILHEFSERQSQGRPQGTWPSSPATIHRTRLQLQPFHGSYHWGFNIYSGSQNESLVKVTRSHVRSKCGSISETVHHADMELSWLQTADVESDMDIKWRQFGWPWVTFSVSHLLQVFFLSAYSCVLDVMLKDEIRLLRQRLRETEPPSVKMTDDTVKLHQHIAHLQPTVSVSNTPATRCVLGFYWQLVLLGFSGVFLCKWRLLNIIHVK